MIGQQPGGGPGSLSVGGNLNISRGPGVLFLANGSVVVGGNLTNPSPFFAMTSSTGNDQLRVGGTLLNQTGAIIYLGNARCFGPPGSCPVNPPPLPILGGPTAAIGTLVNNGTLYSWSNITASTLVNNGLTSLIGSRATVGTVTNGGTLYLSNAANNIFPQPTSSLSVGTGSPNPFLLGYHQSADGVLNEVLTGPTSYG